MPTITCKIASRLDAELEAAAREEGVSKSEIVRRALWARVRRNGQRRAPRALDLVKHLSGSLKGPRDLSVNPKHMRGFGA